jgi:hypothetical protein
MRAWKAVSCIVLIVVLVAGDGGAVKVANKKKASGAAPADDESNDPEVQEERYRDVIKCGSCEKAVERLVERAKVQPLGELVPSGTNRKRTLTQRERSTRAARAIDIVDGACDSESGRERIYCQDAVGIVEDDLVELVVHDGVHPKHSDPKDVCRPLCGYKSDLKSQIEGMQDELRRLHHKPLMQEVLALLAQYWYMWVGFFVATLGAAIFIQFKLLKRYELKKRAASPRPRQTPPQTRVVDKAKAQ